MPPYQLHISNDLWYEHMNLSEEDKDLLREIVRRDIEKFIKQVKNKDLKVD